VDEDGGATRGIHAHGGGGRAQLGGVDAAWLERRPGRRRALERTTGTKLAAAAAVKRSFVVSKASG
jgi:hypothetical protein